MSASRNTSFASTISELLVEASSRSAPAVLLLLPALACGQGPDPSPGPPAVPARAAETVFGLRLDELQRREIGIGETHVYPLRLRGGVFLHLEVEQLGGDVYLELSGPPGFSWPRIDSSDDATAAEPLFVVTGDGGEYQLKVGAYAPGSYELRIDPPRVPEGPDRLQSEAHRAFYGARRLRRDDPAAAAAMYREALQGWSRLGDAAREARALYELSRVLPKDEVEAAQSALDRARRLFSEVGDRLQEARCLHLLGGLQARAGDLESARDLYDGSLSRWRELRNHHEVSVLAFDLAIILRQLGQPETARELLHEARNAARRTKNPLHEARIRTELGSLYHYRGQTAEGVREYRAALRILADPPRLRDREVKKARAKVATRLGVALLFLDGASAPRDREAREHLAGALKLRRELAEPEGLAATLTSVGLLNEISNHPQAAAAAYLEAERIYRSLGAAAATAVALGNRCRVLEHLGRLDAARECFLKSLTVLRQEGYQNGEAQALFGLARIDRRSGALHRAQGRILEALEIVELIRREADRDDLRLSYLDRKYDYHETAVDLALDLHELEPEAGHAAAAFERLENARARGLLEALARFRTELDAPPDLRELREEIHRVKARRLAVRGGPPEDVEKLESELGELLDRLRVASPRYAFVEPRILPVDEVRRLLDPGTLLLEYHLGETRSAVWAISDEDVALRFLPPRAAIEEVARELHQAMRSGSHRLQTWGIGELAAELSRQVLAPVADLLDRPRLVIVPAGALRYVPFAALPHPVRSADVEPPPLLLSHRISSVPSASVLAALRDQHAGRPAPAGLLALVAAPVLRSDDERLEGRRSPPGGAAPPDDLTIAPLPWAAEEARALLELVEGEAVLPALGFEANRDLVLSGALRDFRILHFATHGHLDDAHGELSALSLSRFDASGQQIEGYLLAWELYRLDLRADLVVLSACDTALGEEIRGEGLVGLTRGFFYAGAERMLVSLWRVDDQATARLMESFYRGYLHRRLHPAEALRQAQMELRREGWRAPYYWASFLIEGDWREELPEPAPLPLGTKKSPPA